MLPSSGLLVVLVARPCSPLTPTCVAVRTPLVYARLRNLWPIATTVALLPAATACYFLLRQLNATFFHRLSVLLAAIRYCQPPRLVSARSRGLMLLLSAACYYPLP